MSKKKQKKRHKRVTPKQLAANQQNAQHSTGPVTPEGKEKSSLNSLKHGLTGAFSLLPWENEEAFLESCRMYLAELRPQGAAEYKQVLRVAEGNWRLDRVSAAEARVWAQGTSQKEINAELLRITLYESRIQRGIERAMKEFRRLRSERESGKNHPLPETVFLPEDFLTLESLYKVPAGAALPCDLPLHEEDGEAYREKREDIARSLVDLPDEFQSDEPVKPSYEYDPVTDSNYLSADKVMYLMAKHNVESWFEIAHLYDPSVPPPEASDPTDLAEPIPFPKLQDTAIDSESDRA